MKKKVLMYVGAFVPLAVLNAFSLSSGYFVQGDMETNGNILLLFTILAALIGVAKLFFDFFVALVTSKVVGVMPAGDQVMDSLFAAMLPQWIFTLGGHLLIWLVFPGFAQEAGLILFAAAHSVYYAVAGASVANLTDKKVFRWLYVAIAAMCWIYAICTLIGVVRM